MKKLIRESLYTTPNRLNEGFATPEGDKLDNISIMFGYDDFTEFVGDNPGVMEVILEWIDQTYNTKENIHYLTKAGYVKSDLEEMGLYSIAEEMEDEEDIRDSDAYSYRETQGVYDESDDEMN